MQFPNTYMVQPDLQGTTFNKSALVIMIATKSSFIQSLSHIFIFLKPI